MVLVYGICNGHVVDFAWGIYAERTYAERIYAERTKRFIRARGRLCMGSGHMEVGGLPVAHHFFWFSPAHATGPMNGHVL